MLPDLLSISHLSLRAYQREALDAIYDYFHENSGNPVVSIPTGGGKSLIIAQLLKESFGWWPDTRVLILTHVRELISQNFGELIRLWPEAPAGVHSAGLNKRDTQSPIIFGGIQSLHNRAHELPRVDLVIVDEAHLVPRTASTMYRRFLHELSKINPFLKVVGLTATPYRLDSGMLCEGDDALFTDMVYEANVKDLIDGGFLVAPVSRVQATEIDTSRVGTRGGEFISGQLEAAALDPLVVEHIAQEIVAAGGGALSDGLLRRIEAAENLARRPGTEGECAAAMAAVERLRASATPIGIRKGWLVFACGVKHAEMLCRELKYYGIAAACAFGHTPSAERAYVIDAFKRRELRALVTVGILTTGFNATHVDMIACVRPTKSTGLWVQMIGRGLRLSPETGKTDCIAEGSMILTDHGLVAIERITLGMKIWDGSCFVPHCGIIFRGNQEVIEYAGLTATPDHLVWTQEGWQTFGKCANEQIPIAITGINGTPIRQTDDNFARGTATWTQSLRIRQAKRRVWDILECGPFHRFTAQGLLVHNCLVLDFGGNLARLGPIDAPIVKVENRGEGGEAPEKICPVCGSSVPAAVRQCRECGFVFPDPERTVALVPSELSPLSNSLPEWVKVDAVHYRRHQKLGKPDSMRVDYLSGIMTYREWICFEHEGYARDKACRWWWRRAPEIRAPNTITEALANSTKLREPSEIQVRRTGKYFEIVGARL